MLLLLFLTGALGPLELQAQDRLYRNFGVIHPDIYVLGIDEKTLIEFGPVQFWSRDRMAEAIAILNSDPNERPAVIAVDMLYSGPSDDPASDKALVRVATEGRNVVFGAMVSMNWNGEVRTFEKPFDALERVSRYGILNTVVDSDGVVRHVEVSPVVFGNTEPTFPEAIVTMYTGMDAGIPESIGNPLYLAYSGSPGDYYGAVGLGTSFRDIFDEDFDPSFYADTIVFIGPYAAGLMDSYFTAADAVRQMHGIEIHANIVQMLLDENFKGYAPSWVNLAALVLTLILFSVVFMRTDVRVSFAVLVLFATGYVFLNKWIFNNGYIIMLIYPPVSAAVLYVFSVVYNYITERIEKKKIKDMFKKYVDPKLVDMLIQSDTTDGGIGKKKHFAVLFVDIRGFTPMSEKLADEPEAIVDILNNYLELTASCVFNNGGSVDKFIGDATMALFNGFTPLEDYTYHACKTAMEIVEGAETLNEQIMEKYGFGVGFGVGVHCGYAIVGNIGPNYRKDYTAIGDTVNTAARLESNASKSQVLISKEVYDTLTSRITADSLGEIAMKGKGPVEVFALTKVI